MNSVLDFFASQLEAIKLKLRGSTHASGPKRPSLSQQEKG
jgi:hypothetical protein